MAALLRSDLFLCNGGSVGENHAAHSGLSRLVIFRASVAKLSSAVGAGPWGEGPGPVLLEQGVAITTAPWWFSPPLTNESLLLVGSEARTAPLVR